jgi:hypothetical protein
VWLDGGYAGNQKTNKKITQNDFVSKAPSGRELDFAKQKTEGECDIIIFAFTISCVSSFRQPSVDTFLPEEGFVVVFV